MTLISVYMVTHPVCRREARSVQQPRFWWRHQKATRERSNYGKLEKQHSCRMELKKFWVWDPEFPQTLDSRAGVSQTSGSSFRDQTWVRGMKDNSAAGRALFFGGAFCFLLARCAIRAGAVCLGGPYPGWGTALRHRTTVPDPHWHHMLWGEGPPAAARPG